MIWGGSVAESAERKRISRAGKQAVRGVEYVGMSDAHRLRPVVTTRHHRPLIEDGANRTPSHPLTGSPRYVAAMDLRFVGS